MGCGSSTAAPVIENGAAHRPEGAAAAPACQPGAGAKGDGNGGADSIGEPPLSPGKGVVLTGEDLERALREDLPVGWQARVDPNSGQIYYVDHATQSTSWEKPAATDSITTARWSCKIDADSGERYYEDHVTKTTQWHPPPGFEEPEGLAM
mmetsp:Transcript_24829/g.48278  ORF Transcript_24829/g.48278 Transcript_24829/m.48278 type:complete len:151 (+) Transcript_24829:244-696(+)